MSVVQKLQNLLKIQINHPSYLRKKRKKGKEGMKPNGKKRKTQENF